MKPVILLGGGGHAKVLLSLLARLRVEVLGIVDPHRPAGSECLGIRVLGEDTCILAYAVERIELVNGIGSLPGDTGVRAGLYGFFHQQGYRFKTLADPRAFVAAETELAEGVQIMAGAIIQAGTIIAENSLVNSGAIVEHDCRIGCHVHIAPGAVLSGNVDIGDKVHIGTGATLIQGIKVGAGSVIGAGSVVTRDIGAGQIVYPARSQVQNLI